MNTYTSILCLLLSGFLFQGCGSDEGGLAESQTSSSASAEEGGQRASLQRTGDSGEFLGQVATTTTVRYYPSQAGRLLTSPATTSGTLTLESATGSNHDGTPYRPVVLQASGLQGNYSGGRTQFALPLDAGSAVATGSQARVSYDFEGDGQWDRQETYAYFASNNTPGWETYRDSQGLRSATGSMRDFNNGNVRLEVWNAIGRNPVSLRTDDASSFLEVPMSGTTTPMGPSPSPTPPTDPTPSPSPTTPPNPTPTPGSFNGTLYLGPTDLTNQPSLSGQLTVASADGSNRDGTPYHPLRLQASGLWGRYNGSSTSFQLFVDAGSQVAYATQLRLSCDFDGNGTPDRVETYNYFPTNNVNDWETYTQAKGIRSATGTWADFRGGSLTLEVWSALGRGPTTLRLNGSRVVLPISSDSTVPSPTPTPEPTPTSTPSPAEWTLTWQDEFNAPNNSKPVAEKWSYQLGGNGFGNNELQTYTDRLDNVRVENGHLTIEARKENFTGNDGIARGYTSGRLHTLGKFSQAYGKIEARIKIPGGQGIWPAFWMMGQDKPQVGWPACGEIDIMENIGREPSTVHGTAHGPGYSGGGGIGASYQLPSGQRFRDDYHLFSVEWKPNFIQWKVDGKTTHTLTPNMLPAGSPWAFNKPFYILLNVAVGGQWPGYPDATTVLPQQMEVDYVRVYRAGP